MAESVAAAGGNEIDFEEISRQLQEVQDHICSFFVDRTGEQFTEDCWKYDKGKGGGRTRVWEAPNDPSSSSSSSSSSSLVDGDGDGGKVTERALEKAGVNFSALEGSDLPSSASDALKLAQGPAEGDKEKGFKATGVSLVIHPTNPHVPTIHMNVRYFETANSVWWFGGGIDLTPNYILLDQVIDFHRGLKEVCDRHGQDYDRYKKQCDEYFFLRHRNENRGVGGIFFDHLDARSEDGVLRKEETTKSSILAFIVDLGRSFTTLYDPFLRRLCEPFTAAQREFQLWRRSRYVEFNLLWDRGTKFGIQSQGRTESILMSLPAVAKWRYNWSPDPSTPEGVIVNFFLQFQDWLHLSADILSRFQQP